MIEEQAIKILLVEDSPTDGLLILRLLKKGNLENQIVWIKDGAEALAFIFAADPNGNLKNIPDLKFVLLDLKLPRVDGLEVLRQIKSENRTRTIPVIMFSSSNQESDLKSAYDLGVNSYIVKEIDYDEFSHTIAGFSHYWLALNQTPEGGHE